MIGLIIFYLIGFIIVFCGYIYLIKKEDGYVILKDILYAIAMAITSWISIIAVLITYITLWLKDNIDWNKRLF